MSAICWWRYWSHLWSLKDMITSTLHLFIQEIASSQHRGVEWVCWPVPILEWQQPKEFTLVLSKDHLHPRFTLFWADESSSPPWEEANWPMSIPLGAQLDFASLGSLQVTISHYPVKGEVQYEYQSLTIAMMSMAQTSLQLALPEPPDQPDSSPWIEELWANAMLFNWPTSLYATPKPLDEL